ncbi:GNAT family N-acetyltransferase [Actinospica robiniae]|uniref:GNAT family N-acetyltransferase n=1 Tax=Actinospica robiniae TaxID=304901 RepID=UPI00041C4A48|nr:GNAT family N-acetyltransferase [Actinospica robiniae]
MSPIHDLAPQLANARAFWLGYGAESRLEGDLTTYRSGLGSPSLNGVLRWTGSDFDDAHARAALEFAGVPWWWWVGPDSRADTADRLRAWGGKLAARQPIMAMDLDHANLPEPTAALTIVEVTDPATLREWVSTIAPVFGVPSRSIEARTALEFGREGDITRFAGTIDGRIVATASLFDAHGIAGVYTVATAEGFRRRGFGAAMTAAVMRAGRERGLKVATLQSSSAGEPVYLRMGFQQVAEYRIFTPPDADAKACRGSHRQ